MKNLQIQVLESELTHLTNMINGAIRTIDEADKLRRDAEKQLAELNETYSQKLIEFNEITGNN